MTALTNIVPLAPHARLANLLEASGVSSIQQLTAEEQFQCKARLERFTLNVILPNRNSIRPPDEPVGVYGGEHRLSILSACRISLF